MGRKPSLRWSREPNETGLRRVVQGTRGWILKRAGLKLGVVSPWYRNPFLSHTHAHDGWYWCSGGFNSLAAKIPPYKTDDEAKRACVEYVNSVGTGTEKKVGTEVGTPKVEQ